MFSKLLRFDLKYGLSSILKTFAFIFVFFIFICLDFESQYAGALMSGLGIAETKTIADIAIFMFGGMREYIPSPHESFLFPSLWILLFVILIYSVLRYPYDNLQGFGKQLLVNSTGRKYWWLSKCVWNIVSITLFFAAIWLFLLVYSLLTKTEISMKISPYIANVFSILPIKENISELQVAALLIIAPWLTAVTLSILQMTIALYVKPILSFVSIVVILIASAYYCNFLLIGNFAMCIRSDIILNSDFVKRGIIPYGHSLLFVLFVLAASIIVGMFSFKKYDILNKD